MSIDRRDVTSQVGAGSGAIRSLMAAFSGPIAHLG